MNSESGSINSFKQNASIKCKSVTQFQTMAVWSSTLLSVSEFAMSIGLTFHKRLLGRERLGH
jgi:hypothetical protein